MCAMTLQPTGISNVNLIKEEISKVTKLSNTLSDSDIYCINRNQECIF